MADQDTDSPEITGSCACRRITFRTGFIPTKVTCCYCRECAKQSGAGYLPFATFPISSVQWSMEPDIWRSSQLAERGYCKECGTTVNMLDRIDPDGVGIPLSMIDSSNRPLPKASSHISLQEKADWVYVPEDGSEKYDQFNIVSQVKFEKLKASIQ